MASNTMLVEAVRVLTKGQENATSVSENSKKGVTVSDIERWLVSQKYYLTKDEFKCPLHVSLQKEVNAGRLEKLPSGTYVLSKQQLAKDRAQEMKQKASLKRTVSTPGKKGRPKKKKLKRFHSQYDEAVVDDEECPVDPPQPTEDDGNCDYCLQTADNNKNGEREELLECKDCNAKAHPSCMGYSEILSNRAKLYPWQCIDCKTCCLCLDASDPDSMLFCDACDKGYHMNCHVPVVRDKPLGKWICRECTDQGITESDLGTSGDNIENGILVDTDPNVSKYPTPCASPVAEQTEDNRNDVKVNGVSHSLRIEKGKYPDASKWTTDDVVQFFINVGFRDQAEAFREQEIDGQSLLLMKRSDVLTGLYIRLGPALKIYQHVLKLQAVGLDSSFF